MGRFSQLQFHRENAKMVQKWKENVEHSKRTALSATPATRITLTTAEGLTTVPAPVSGVAGQFLTVQESLRNNGSVLSGTSTEITAPDDYEMMMVQFGMGEVEMVIFSDANHNEKLTLTTHVETRGKYTSLKNDEMVVIYSKNSWRERTKNKSMKNCSI